MGNSQGRRSASTTLATPEHNESELPTLPTGLYPSCEWNQKIVTRLIVQKKLAPRYKGSEIEFMHSSECPICFLNYAAINKAKCCNGDVCTECFLQVKTPSSESECPFCKSPSFGVVFNGISHPPRSMPMAIPSAASSPSVSAASTPETRPASAPSSITSNVMTPESRLQLEAQMRHQRDDCITSESYAPSVYARSRSGSYGGRGSSRSERDRERPTSGLNSRRHSQDSRGARNYRGAARYYDDQEDDRLELFSSLLHNPPGHHVAFERHMRAANQRRSEDREMGASTRSNPRGGLHRHLGGRSNVNEGTRQAPATGGDLEQLEEMLLMEAIRLSMREAEEAEAKSKQSTSPPTDPAKTPSSGPPGLLPPPGLSLPKSAVAAPAPLPSPPLPTTASSDGVSEGNDVSLAMAMGWPDGDIDLDTADDDMLLTYALSLSQMNDSSSSKDDKKVEVKDAVTSSPASCHPNRLYEHEESSESLSAQDGNTADSSCLTSNLSSSSTGAADSVTAQGHISENDSAIGRTPSPSRLLKKGSSSSELTPSAARLLSMIDAALESPVGEYKYIPRGREQSSDGEEAELGGLDVKEVSVDIDLSLDVKSSGSRYNELHEDDDSDGNEGEEITVKAEPVLSVSSSNME